MDGKTKSIILQVAFKEATAAGDIDEVKNLTVTYYEMLLGLHTELGIDASDGGFKPRGNRTFNVRTTPAPKAAPPASASQFTAADGSVWIDYRGAKTAGEVKPNFPDFKTADGKQSVWAYDRDGAPNSDAVELTAAADAMASLAAPM